MLPVRDGFELARQIRRADAAGAHPFSHGPLAARRRGAGLRAGHWQRLASKSPLVWMSYVVRIRALLGRPPVARSYPLGGGRAAGHRPLPLRPPAAAPEPWPTAASRPPSSHPPRGRTAQVPARPAQPSAHAYRRAAGRAVGQRLASSTAARSMCSSVRLRRYLRHDPQVQIVNVRGVGYKLLPSAALSAVQTIWPCSSGIGFWPYLAASPPPQLRYQKPRGRSCSSACSTSATRC